MVDELQSYGIEPMVTVWPFQSTSSIHWQEYSTSGYLVTQNGSLASYDGGNQYLIDQTNPVVRANAFSKFMQGYGQYGFKTIWVDAAEPEHFGGSSEGSWKLLAGTDAEVGAAWVRDHAKMYNEGFATQGIQPGDYFILPRSAWIGTWRYSAALWSGDIQSSFEELSLQVRALQGVMMSGVALWTTGECVSCCCYFVVGALLSAVLSLPTLADPPPCALLPARPL